MLKAFVTFILSAVMHVSNQWVKHKKILNPNTSYSLCFNEETTTYSVCMMNNETEFGIKILYIPCQVPGAFYSLTQLRNAQPSFGEIKQ